MSLTATAIATLLSGYKNEILKKLNDIKDEVDYLIDNGLKQYVVNLSDKYGRTKTFLYRDTPVDFYDIYYPLSVKNERTILDVDDINKLFSKGDFITILGNAGSGKSMLVKHIFLSCLKRGSTIPIVIEWRSLNSFVGTIEEYVKNIIFDNKLSKNEKICERILECGSFLFLFHGFDELSCSDKDGRIVELNKFIDKYYLNQFLITSRPGAQAESLLRFENYFVQALNMKQIKEFIHLQLELVGDMDLETKIIKEISKMKNSSYRSYLSNPLLLSMFLLTYRDYPELPKSKSKFYFNVFYTLCIKHDSITKGGGFVHDKKTKLQNEDFEEILMWFSYMSFFDEKYEFDLEYLREKLLFIKKHLKYNVSIDDLIYDLTVSISIIIIDGATYTFPHRSLQEYFTACLIRKQKEESKKKIYEVKFSHKMYMRNDNDNFWSLCEELDKYCFNKYYIVPSINSFIMLCSKGSLAECLIKLFNISIIKLGKDKDSKVSGYTLNDRYRCLFNYIPNAGKLYLQIVNVIRTACMENMNQGDWEEKRFDSYDDINEKMNIILTPGLEHLSEQLFDVIVKDRDRRVEEMRNDEFRSNMMLDFC